MHALLNVAALASVLFLFASWGVLAWSQRKRLVRLWLLGVPAAALWSFGSMLAISWGISATQSAQAAEHACGTGTTLAIAAPSMLGLPLMLITLCVLTLATLWHRRRSKLFA